MAIIAGMPRLQCHWIKNPASQLEGRADYFHVWHSNADLDFVDRGRVPAKTVLEHISLEHGTVPFDQ